jgi:hypothetical protein
MNNKILLASFITVKQSDDFFNKLDTLFSIKKDKTFIFSLGENLMVTFKLTSTNDLKEVIKTKLKNTIQIHKKSNSFYTINALNKLIQRDFNLVDGNIDYKSYSIDWDKYQDKLFLLKEGELLIQDIKKVIL